MKLTLRGLWLLSLLLSAILAGAQEVTLTARVTVAAGDKSSTRRNPANVVIWLTPAAGTAGAAAFRSAEPARLLQKKKSFEPHVLVVPAGAVVEFPNQDPFFHNVFSLFEGKRFDLGLYEAGSTRDVHFDKPGISYIFCNIHPEMSAVVLALDSPYYGISDARGEVVIAKVPAGKYVLRLWYETALPEALKVMTRTINVSEASSTLGVFRLTAPVTVTAHKNLYGRDYDPPAPDNPAYQRP